MQDQELDRAREYRIKISNRLILGPRDVVDRKRFESEDRKAYIFKDQNLTLTQRAARLDFYLDAVRGGRQDNKSVPDLNSRQKKILWRVQRALRLISADKDEVIFRRVHNTNIIKMTRRQYNVIFEKQQGVCAICSNEAKDGKRLNIDHCHISGKIRELLCFSCNIALGYFKDDRDLLLKAAEYVWRHRAE